ncbi:M1 family metallopeptidase [Yeosuana sp.]|uniref:M1 family metallopeptidase n=1 Tax=Yeosuana sp. TaxID=2529388 RepID=UPI004054A9E0|tara:strand:- start:3109 stop:5079 length:1971 start_codon:yes stop_codon:yes gene_type:complete
MNRLLLILLLFFISKTYAQQTKYVDFKTAQADISFGDLKQQEVIGTVIYEFDILKKTDSIYLDAIDFTDVSYVLDGTITGDLYDGKHLIIKQLFKRKSHHKLVVNWKTNPKKAMYFIDWEDPSAGSGQVWTQGQGKYTSNWLPSIDDMNEKVEFDLKITFNKDFEVIANGSLTNKQIDDSTTTWHYDMKKPMSSYLVALAIGKYHKKVELSNSGIPLEMYYYPDPDSHRDLKVEPTYRYTKRMFDFLENEIGVPYPWQNYKQVPVKDFLYAGMENTSTTIFSDSFLIDSIAFIDKNYVNVNAHELAHQWFGNLVTESSGKDHWLQEGFATYYALLAEKEIFGNDYYYWRLFEYAQELISQDEADEGTSLINPKASSSTFYKRGAWVLYMLREKVGDVAFKKAIKNYLHKHEFKNVTTSDFISEVEKTSGQDLSKFVGIWIETVKFPSEMALNILNKSAFIQEYRDVNCGIEYDKCVDYLTSGISDEIKIKIIGQIPDKLTFKAFDNSLKVRQAIAKNVVKIPLELKKDYETLLQDKSYLTIEMALYNLWDNFPSDRVKYLDKTKNIQGLNHKNVRMLWLVLAINTPDFEPKKKQLYFEELRGYTSPEYGFETRQSAFEYLKLMKACDAFCKNNLMKATKHYNWRFSKFAKDMLNEI